MRAIISGPSHWRSIAKFSPARCRLLEGWILGALRQLEQTYGDLSVASTLHLGLDTLFARICYENEIPYHIVLACPNQHEYWDDEAKKTFETLRTGAFSEALINPDTYSDGSIGQQYKEILDWLLDTKEEKAMLLVKKGPLSKTQAERKRVLRQTGAIIRVFNW
jgi:hypothetical protein